MCRKKQLTQEQIDDRRAKRSAFLSRLVDEFKKIAFIALFFVLVGGIVWCFILMGKGITVNYLLPLGLAGSLVTIFGVYCASSTAEKKSLNKNGLVKDKGGTDAKIVDTVITTASKFTTAQKSDNPSDDAVG